VSNFSKLAVRFALRLDAIDLDRYLPPGKEAPPAKPGAAAGKVAAVPTDSLRALDVAGTFNADKVTIAKLTLTAVQATLKAKDGLIRLSPVAAKLYAGNISLDARNKVPAIALNEKLSEVKIGPLLTDLQGKDQVTGIANISVKIKAIGTPEESIKQSLNGNLSFQFLDGPSKA
jgi:AsmA protein